MKLTVAECLGALGAFKGLDGYDKVVKQGGTDASVHVSYTFNGITRMAIARNIAALAAVHTSYLQARNGLVKQFSESGAEVPPQNMPAFSQQNDDLLAADVEVDVKALTATDLQIDANPIPPSLLASLLPVMDFAT